MLRRFFVSNIQFKRAVSALYVTGDKASENFAVLTPFLEIDKRMKNFKEIEENLQRRKLELNLENLRHEYELFGAVKTRKKELEDRRVEIAKIMKTSASEGLKLQGKMVRDDLKKLKENSYHLEDQFVHNFLKIPNIIHPKTPNQKQVVYSHLEKQSVDHPNSKLDQLIEYYDPKCYYMKGNAAKFDLFTALDVCDYLRDAGFIKFSNPDFVRSIVPEGAGIDPQKLYLIKEDDIDNKLNLLHLTGSGSFVSYLPFVSKLVAFPTQFPLKFISTGKIYDKLNDQHNDLYNVVQSTCCQVFWAEKDADTFDQVIEEIIGHIQGIYKQFDQHYRIVFYPANVLENSEAFKIGVEMYSVCKECYVEVGNFSYHSDFISKRLLFNYKVDKAIEFPHIYSGTIVNVMKVLVNLVEFNKI